MNLADYVEFKHIEKVFPGVRALKDISFKVESGIVYAFLGENGAGKSTLLKILNGDYMPTSGEYIINGETEHFSNPKEAIEHGVSVIYQERQIVMDMTVAENVFLGGWPKNSKGLIDYDLMNGKTAEIAKKFGININPKSKASEISIAYQQMVEIMKAINRDCKIIAFDEPTSSLGDEETEILFNIIRSLQSEGKIIFYVSHRMDEIRQIAQKAIIFKDGSLVDVVDVEKTSDDELIKKMVGRSLGDIFKELKRNDKIGEPILEVKNLTTHYVKNVSFKVHKGEILGFSGLVGSGRTETMRALFGVDKVLSGEILLNGKPIHPSCPTDAIKLGIAYCPEDRKEEGILPNMSVGTNITISVMERYKSKFGLLDFGKENKTIQKNIEDLKIKTPQQETLITQLSGGNQQKVILARWLETNPDVLILDEPTKGIDVGAKSEFYKIICECARSGKAVIFISSEMPEIIGMSDRVIVMKGGKISAELSREEANEETILKYAMVSMVS